MGGLIIRQAAIFEPQRFGIIRPAVTCRQLRAYLSVNKEGLRKSDLIQIKDLLVQFCKSGCQHVSAARSACSFELLENALARELHSLQLTDPRCLFGR